MNPEVTGTVDRAELDTCPPNQSIPPSRPVVDTSSPAAHAEQFLRYLADGRPEWREVRALHVARKYGAPVTAAAGFDDPAQAAVTGTAPRECQGVYFTINPVDSVIGAMVGGNPLQLTCPAPHTAGDTMIARRRWLLVDVDPTRPTGVSSTEAELQAAYAVAGQVAGYLREQGWAEGIAVCSGNGAHLYIPIDLPAEDGGLVASVLAHLADRFDTATATIDRKVANPARISALPGTRKRKGFATADRPHRLVQVLAYPAVRGVVSEEQLRALAGQPGVVGASPKCDAPSPATGPYPSTASPPVVDIGGGSGEWRMVDGDFSFSHEGETWTIERFRADTPKGRTKLAECLHGDGTCKPALGKSWLHNYGPTVIGRCEGSAHASGAIKYQPRRLRSDVPAELRNVLAHLDVGENGGVKPHLGNMVEILKRDPMWCGRLRYDAFAHLVMLDGRAIGDHDESSLALYAQQSYAMTIPTPRVGEAMRLVAREVGAFDPLADAFRRLPEWDGVSRYELVVHDILGIPRDQGVPGGYREVWRRFLIGACARAHRPGCKLDTVLILQSEHQGAGKSTFLRILAGDFGFSDARIPIGKGGDTIKQLRTAFLHEWGELQAIRRRDAEEVKEFISQQADSGRGAYERNVETSPRRCVIAGTTNASSFLADDTGSRRFWVLPIPRGFRIDLDALAAIRDQVWAEALAEYRRGAPWWMDGGEEQLVAAMNEEFQEVDPLTDRVASYVALRLLAGADVLRMDEIMSGTLGARPQELTIGNSRRVGSILRGLGWRKARGAGGGRVHWCAPKGVAPTGIVPAVGVPVSVPVADPVPDDVADVPECVSPED